VVAVEIDRGLHALLRRRLADRANVTLLHADVLAGKHAINPEVLKHLGAARFSSPTCPTTSLAFGCGMLIHERACQGHEVKLPGSSSGTDTREPDPSGFAVSIT